MSSPQKTARSEGDPGWSAPSISLPKGGGAIRGIGEKLAANPVTGTGSMTVPIATSPGRSGFSPRLSLSYDSGTGNGPFGFGWSLPLPAVTRKTDKGLPQYRDAEESDVYVLAGSEDLVPVHRPDGRRFSDDTTVPGFVIHRYRPRVEGLFARLERRTDVTTGEIHWRSITRDNVTTLYGKDARSRVFDPADPSPSHATRVFTWLICESYDDKGNAIVYEYAAENDDNVDLGQANERNRVRTANRYLKRIKYGNRVSRLIEPDLTRASWMFEVVFDYDEAHYEEVAPDPGRPEAEQHRRARASASAGRPWAVRPDPFSSHRAGFEVRAYRRCRRVLTFHHIPDLPTGEKGYAGLARSTELDYADLDYGKPVAIADELAHQGSTRFASFLRAVTQSGHVRDETRAVLVRDGVEYATYLEKSLPPLEFEYSKAVLQDDVRELDAASLENLPMGLDGSTYRWVDLDGEGVSGILTEQAAAWLYKPSLGQGRFGPAQAVAALPSPAASSGGRRQLLDLAGDGQLDLVAFSGPAPGFYERTHDEDWEPFRTFRELPNVAWDEPSLRFVDLDGDGRADVLITEQEVFTWYPSLGEEGFGPARGVRQAPDEERGPRLVLVDGTQSVYLADMCGDGLTDLVRVRNGEVCYWPNQGHGRFGPKVAMDDAPWLDHPDRFDQHRVRLADVDGSGTADVIYLARDGPRLYFNQCGNRWSEARRLTGFPRVDDLSSVTTADFLGNGTACLVWSSPLPGDARRPLRYVDLMGGVKPHLLIRSANNLGAETQVHYAPSTRFYLEDKRGGRPWVTRVPFPVHVVERVVTHDRVSGNRFVTRYAYHHGYFDGEERELRGFGLVEQWDTEEFAALAAVSAPAATNAEAASHVPAVLTKTWFHTGVYVGREHVSDFFAGLLAAGDSGQYYREPGLSDHQARALLLDDTVLPGGLTAAEEREACRALKGSMLRREVYALDGTAHAKHPYTVSEQSFTLRVLQRRGGNRHGVFLAHAREAIDYHYERNPADPRVRHVLTLEADDFGNVLRAAEIGYGRRQPDLALSPADQDKQTRILVTYTENRVTNAVDSAGDHRTPQPCESRTYELTGLTLPAGRLRWTLDDVLAAGTTATALDYEETPTAGLVEKRLIEHARTYYRRDDLAGPLPLGDLQALALPFESYKLAFTPGLVAEVYGGRVTGPMLGDEGGYVHTEGDAQWWIPSGRVFYSRDPADTPPQELAFARRHFFLPHRHRDPFHTNAVSTESFVTYDVYDLLLQETRDALGNRVTAGERDADPTRPPVRLRQDYRVLQPAMVMDPNRNQSAVAFDALGMVVGAAAMGKPPPAPAEGDSLAGFSADLTQAEIDRFFADPKGPPAATLLAGATSRVVYDLTAYRREPDPTRKPPAVAATLVRETHAGEGVPAGGPRIQVGFSYSDGFGREIQKKIQAEPGPLGAGGPVAAPRWVGSGWVIFNNKAKPVRQYEPFFSATQRFEFGVPAGVSSILFYDPVERVVATVHPDHTWDKVVFDPWRQKTYDVNDTVAAAGLQTGDPRTDPDVAGYVRDYFEAQPAGWQTWRAQRVGRPAGDPEREAAEKAAAHADTPATAHFDTLGRPYLTLADNGPDPARPGERLLFATRVELDVAGNQRAVIDAEDRVVMRYDYDLPGNRIGQLSMEAGARRMLDDVAGKPLYAWDSRGHRFRTAHDALRRPTEAFVQEGAGVEVVVGRTVYGESRPNAEADNLRGRVAQLFDQAGVASSDAYDFKGNPLRSRRQLAHAYSTTLDWSAAVPLDAPVYTSLTRYDALDRPIQLIAPHSDQPGAAVNVIQPVYNEANLLEEVHAWLDENAEPAGMLAPGTADLHAVKNIDYDAKGRRLLLELGNGAETTYDYDPLTFRLSALRTRRPAAVLQDFRYTYDPAGNVTRLRDGAQPAVFFNNQRVEPDADYTYDALYRLIEATGREHLGQVGAAPQPASYNDRPRVGNTFAASDGNALGRYVERYVYDAAGNFEEMKHVGTDPANPGWTRSYTYAEPSQIEAGKPSNRLTSTFTNPMQPERYSTGGDGYDAHGNMLRMPHMQEMRWDFLDQLRMTRRQKVNAADADGAEHDGERTWYVYDAGGERVRKVTERAADVVKEERIYLGGFEIFRRAGANALVRETLHIMDDQQRIALVETRTEGNEAGVPARLVRFQLGNHLGSASLELDDQGRIISYEEYTPYGSTSYQAARSRTETPKRYRYTGKERDEESGLYYHGARYYAPWLGRWTSCDPIVSERGSSLYAYAEDNPLYFIDPNGAQAVCPKSGCTPEITDYYERTGILEREKNRREAFENENPEVRFAREHPTATAIIEAIQFAGSVAFLAQDINSLTSGVSMNRSFATLFRSRAPSSPVTAQATKTTTGAQTPPPAKAPAAASLKTVPVPSATAPEAPKPPATPPPVAAASVAPTTPPQSAPAPTAAVSVEPISPNVTSTPHVPAGYPNNPRNLPIDPQTGEPRFHVWRGGLLRSIVRPGETSDGINQSLRRRFQSWSKNQGTIDGPPTTRENTVVGHTEGQAHVLTPRGLTAQVAPQSVPGNQSWISYEKREAALRRAWNAANPDAPQLPVRPLGQRRD